MIKGIGLDIIELERIKKSIEKNDKIIERILTPRERKAYNEFTNKRRKVEYLAGRFAAKEAFAKAVGTGIGSLSFQHINVLSNDLGAPTLEVTGYDSNKLFLSITHSRTVAAAQVIILK